MNKKGLILVKWAFGAYCLLMLWLLFGQRIGTGAYGPGKNYNLDWFSTIRWFAHVLREVEDPALRRHAVVNLVGNVVMFVPAGFFLPVFAEKTRNFFCFIAASVGIIVLIELVQFAAALGCCDVDDLVLNLPGMVLGYLIRAFIFRNKKTEMSS